jgi:hypothetical protein
MSKSLWLLALLLVMQMVSSQASIPDEPTLKKTFDGPSTKLKNTRILPTLETPIEKDCSAIWCASFSAAWKTLAADIAKADIALEGSPQAAALLNKAGDPRPHIPKGCLYVAAGWNQKGIIDRIRQELKAAFPAKPAPVFPGIDPSSFVAYSYLEANVKFTLPYFQNRKPLEFTDSLGRKTNTTSFGIRTEDDYAYYQLRGQPRVLFRKGMEGGADMEFAVDLSTQSSPSQIIVARIRREPTLVAALARIEKEENASRELRKKDPGLAGYMEAIGPNDVLLVPDLFWQISHRFSELEGRRFSNSALQGQSLDLAQQDILFRLDRSGAELKSESKTIFAPIPTCFVMDRPFLICMRKRGAAMPYFVMWVDNAELLTPWPQ